MTSKIQFIEVNGKQLNVELFSTDIQQLVATYELTRDRFNIRNTEAQALQTYMNALATKIQQSANEWVDAQFGGSKDKDAAESDQAE